MDLKEIFINPIYGKLAITTLGFFVIGYLIWLMYVSLSKKDLFELKKHKNTSEFLEKFLYVLKFGLLFPFYSFIWYLVFVIALYIMSDKLPLETILFIGVVLVTAIRICAYVSEKLSEDFAKLLPLTLISIIIMNPTFIKLNAATFSTLYTALHSIEVLRYFIFIILAEILLRLISYGVMKFKEEYLDDYKTG